MESPLMTVKETAKYMRVHPTSIYRLLKQGKLPALKLGSDWRFLKSSIDAWMVSAQVNQGRAGK